MAQRASNWQILLDSNVDAALLQEAKAPTEDLKNEFLSDREDDWNEQGFFGRAAVVGMVKVIQKR